MPVDMRHELTKNLRAIVLLALVSLMSLTVTMKINQKTIKAIRANKPAIVATPKAKKQSSAKTTAKAAKVTGRSILVALLSGARGFAARLVERLTYSDGSVAIRAIHNNSGLTEKESTLAPIVGGKLTSKADRKARVQLGGYVNGRNTGAKVELITQAEFAKRSKPCIIHWNVDDAGVHGRYIGNPAEAGMCAVSCKFGSMEYFWQMEQDSNSNNKHERGELQPVKKGETLKACA